MNINHVDSFQSSPPFKIKYSDDRAVEVLTENLLQQMHKHHDFSEMIVLCIGTDRSTGDSLGPLVGHHLEKKIEHPRFHVYGTLDQPVHAVNLRETLQQIDQTFEQPLTIAIDACLGKFTSVGKISVNTGPLKPGVGVHKKDLPEVGTFHMTGIVNVGGFMEYFVLQNTRLSLVMGMSEVMAQSLHKTFEVLEMGNVADPSPRSM